MIPRRDPIASALDALQCQTLQLEAGHTCNTPAQRAEAPGPSALEAEVLALCTECALSGVRQRQMLRAMMACRNSDFSVRVPADWAGVAAFSGGRFAFVNYQKATGEVRE